MNYRIWYSTESFADYIIANTNLRDKNVIKKKMYESLRKVNKEVKLASQVFRKTK